MFTLEHHTSSVLEGAEASEEIFERFFDGFAERQVRERKREPFSSPSPILFRAGEGIADSIQIKARYQLEPIDFRQLLEMAPVADIRALQALAGAPARLD
jgi:hypothetical protein